MPIKIQNDLPAREILEKEQIFVVDENRACHQDIRSLQICILNLMPLKEDTELQLLRSMSNTPLQIDVSFMQMSSHHSTNTSPNHLNRFYNTFEELKDRTFDGLIITGAPVEQMPFEEVDYWDELCKVFGTLKPSWLERNWQALPKNCVRQPGWTDERGEKHTTSRLYARNKIQRLFASGEIEDLRCRAVVAIP